jgi:hypothetical protein
MGLHFFKIKLAKCLLGIEAVVKSALVLGTSMLSFLNVEKFGISILWMKLIIICVILLFVKINKNER